MPLNKLRREVAVAVAAAPRQCPAGPPPLAESAALCLAVQALASHAAPRSDSDSDSESERGEHRDPLQIPTPRRPESPQQWP